MTMTETRTTAAERQNGHDDHVPSLSDQVVMSTAGVASQGFSTLRRVADGAVTTVDRLMLGTFEIADHLIRSNIVSDLATKTVAVARDTWSTGVTAARQLLTEV